MILKGMNCDAFLMQDCYRIYLDDILKTKILKKGKKNQTQVIYLHDKEQLILLLFMEARLLLQEVYWRKKTNLVISVGKMMNHVVFGKNMIQTQWNQKEYFGRFYFFLR